MTRGMHPMLRFALLLCPSEFRRHCAQELAADLDRAHDAPLPLGLTCLNVAWTGIRLHAENIWRDVSYAARVLAKAPVFVAVAFLTIALAIAANVTAFSILKGMLIDPLPYAQGDRIAFISSTQRGEDHTNIDYPDAHDYALRSRTFSAISVETQAQAALTGMGRPVELQGWYVDGSYFEIIGLHAQLGRLLTPADLGKRNVVISDSLWRERFGVGSSVLGRRITLNDRVYTIVGVAPPGTVNSGPGFMSLTDYWVPIDPRDYSTNWRGNYAFFAIGKLRPGVSWAAAQADLSRIAGRLAREYPRFDSDRGVRVRPLADALVAQMRTMVMMLYGAAVLVLLIAAANIGNLLLVRGSARERDLAVRSALGATRRRIAVQLAIEMGLVSAAALAAGLAGSWSALRGLGTLLTSFAQSFGTNMMVPGWNHVTISAGVIVYAVLVTALFTLATAAAPAYILARDSSALSGATRVVGRARLRTALAVSELVLAFAVLCIAALLLQSFLRLDRTPVGFREANMYAIETSLPPAQRYSTNADVVQFYARAAAALRALPGVTVSAEGLNAGLGRDTSTNFSTAYPIGSSKSGPANDQWTEFNSVSPTFFQALRIPLFAGRPFADSDTSRSQPVAIVNERFALHEFGSIRAAIGRHVSVGESSDSGFPLRRIVGVVGNVRNDLASEPPLEVYVPFAQVTFPGSLVVHTAQNDPHLASEVGNAIARIDPLLPAPQIVSFAQLRALDDVMTRIAAIVFLALAAVALLLALAGVYGVVAYGVQRRTREFGIRMSLGARTWNIAAGILREAAVLCAVGVALGSALAALAARGMGQMLYETSPLDVGTFLGAAAFLLVAVLLATAVPVLRATRVPPASALRYE